jgi:hypothetical protein
MHDMPRHTPKIHRLDIINKIAALATVETVPAPPADIVRFLSS